MNVIKLTVAQRRAIHEAICRGGGVGGAAQATRIDRRTLARLVDGDGGDAFLSGLADASTITREEWDALAYPYRGDGERLASADLRARYAALLRDRYGDEIERRTRTEAEREAAERRAEEKRAEAERTERERRQREAEERREERAERTRAALEESYGKEYERLRAVFQSVEVLFGTPAERDAGLGGWAKTDAREAKRLAEGVIIQHYGHTPTQWREYGQRMVKTARETLGAVLATIREHADDIRDAGLRREGYADGI